MMFYIWWTSLSQKKLDEINYEKASPDNLGTLIFLNVIFTYANTVCLVLSYSSWGYKEGAPMNPTAGFFFPIHILLFLGKKKKSCSLAILERSFPDLPVRHDHLPTGSVLLLLQHHPHPDNLDHKDFSSGLQELRWRENINL